MKLGIMLAMEEELKPLLEKFENIKIEEYFGKKFFITKFKNIDICIVQSGIGKINSAVTATQLIEKFLVEKIFFSGVGGALVDDLKIGDIVVAEKLAQWDVDITSFGHKKGYLPGQEIFSETKRELLELVKGVELVSLAEIKGGIIVSGDKFVESLEEKKEIAKTFSADVVEMEGASVARVCDIYGIDFLIVRSISDELNDGAVKDFNLFLEKSANNSAEFVFKVVEKMIK